MKILFICSGNTCRSPMAEALFRDLYKDQPEPPQIASAGLQTWPGDEATREAVLALAERGIDLSQHRSRSASPQLLDVADLIVTMTAAHRDMLLLGNPRLADKMIAMTDLIGEDISDPYGSDLATYRQCAEQILRGVEKLQQRLREKSDNKEGN